MTIYVYRLYDVYGDLLYIGTGKDPARRLADHRRRKPWRREIDRQTTEPYPDRATAEVAEAIAIHTEYPRHNRAWNVNPARPIARYCYLSGPRVRLDLRRCPSTVKACNRGV